MRRNTTSAVVISIVALVVAACSGPVVKSPNAGTDVESGLITASQAVDLLAERNGDPGFVLLDIRTDAEVAAGHISGSESLDFYAPAFRERLAELDRSKTILIYCRTGNRTGQAYVMMEDLGFEEVYDLDGGITEWIASGYVTCVGQLDGDHVCSGLYQESPET